jgi:hypothetical protein
MTADSILNVERAIVVLLVVVAMIHTGVRASPWTHVKRAVGLFVSTLWPIGFLLYLMSRLPPTGAPIGWVAPTRYGRWCLIIALVAFAGAAVRTVMTWL